MGAHVHEIPELDRKGLRDFGITTGAMIALLFGLFFPWLFNLGYPRWPWILFGILAFLGLAVPNVLRPVYKGWMRFGLLMSRVTTPLILGIVFFGVLLPMGILMRWFRKHDPMARKLDDNQSTYRVASKKAARESLERPF